MRDTYHCENGNGNRTINDVIGVAAQKPIPVEKPAFCGPVPNTTTIVEE